MANAGIHAPQGIFQRDIFQTWQRRQAADGRIGFCGNAQTAAKKLMVARPRVGRIGIEQMLQTRQAALIGHIPQRVEPRIAVFSRLTLDSNASADGICAGGSFPQHLRGPLGSNSRVAIGGGNHASPLPAIQEAAAGVVHQQTPGRADMGAGRRQGNLRDMQRQARGAAGKAAGNFGGLVGAVICQEQDFVAVWVKRVPRQIHLMRQRRQCPCQGFGFIADWDNRGEFKTRRRRRQVKRLRRTMKRLVQACGCAF